MAKKKASKKAQKEIKVRLKKPMAFDELMQQIVTVKPPKNKPQKPMK
jgi:hypothetical protein